MTDLTEYLRYRISYAMANSATTDLPHDTLSYDFLDAFVALSHDIVYA